MSKCLEILYKCILLFVLVFLLQSCILPSFPEIKNNLSPENAILVVQIKKGGSGFFGLYDWDHSSVVFSDVSLNGILSASEDNMLVRQLKPGTYKISDLKLFHSYIDSNSETFSTQSYKPNLEFTVQAGKVNSIGLLVPINVYHKKNTSVLTYRFKNLNAVKRIIDEKYPDLASTLTDQDYVMVEGEYHDEKLHDIRKLAIIDYIQANSNKKRKSPVRVEMLPGGNLFFGDLGTLGSIVDKKIKLYETNTTSAIGKMTHSGQTPLLFYEKNNFYELIDERFLEVKGPKDFIIKSAVRFNEQGLLLISTKGTFAVRHHAEEDWTLLKIGSKSNLATEAYQIQLYSGNDYTEDDEWVYIRLKRLSSNNRFSYIKFNKNTHQFSGVKLPYNHERLLAYHNHYFLFAYDNLKKKNLFFTSNHLNGPWSEKEAPFSNGRYCHQYAAMNKASGDHELWVSCWFENERQRKNFIGREFGNTWEEKTI